MNSPGNDYKTILSSVLEEKDDNFFLNDVIMSRILVAGERKKVQRKTEKIIVRIYVTATVLSVMALWFVFRRPNVPLRFSIDLQTFSTTGTEIIHYTQIAILVFVLALLFLGLHLIKRKLPTGMAGI